MWIQFFRLFENARKSVSNNRIIVLAVNFFLTGQVKKIIDFNLKLFLVKKKSKKKEKEKKVNCYC